MVPISSGSSGSSPSRQTTKSYVHETLCHSQMDFECLEKIHSNKFLCDVVLVAEGREISAHKLILALCSTFFYVKFSRDRDLGVLKHIQLENVTFETLSTVINYLYKSKIIITEENVIELLAAAHMLVLQDLQQACRDFLEENLNSTNCFRTGKAARQYQCEQLVSVVHSYILKHFSEIIRHDECYAMAYDDVLDLISNDALCTSEEDVLEYVIKWVRHDLQQRKQYVYSLLQCVRFSLIPHKYMLQRFSKEKWLESDSAYESFLGSIFKFSVLGGHISSKPRQTSKLLIAAGKTNGFWSFESYDFQKKTWRKWSNSNKIKWEQSGRSAFLGSKVYYIADRTLKFIDISNPATTNVSDCGEIFEDIHRFGMAVQNSTVYIVGGLDKVNNKNMSTAGAVETSSGKFKKIANMSEAKRSVGLGVLNGKLYAAGGRIGNLNNCKTVQCYTPATDTWYTIPDMSIQRCESAVAALGDTLYVIGGFNIHDACKQVESFHPVDFFWRRLPDMNVPRRLPGVITVNEQLYVIGGKNGNTILTSVEVYDPKSNSWSMLPSCMTTAMDFVTVALVDKEDIEF